MKLPILVTIAFFLTINFINGQSFEKNYPATLVSPSDTFYVRFSNYPKLLPLTATKRDTTDMGTDGSAGLSATIYLGKDSVVIPYNNFPYWAVHYIPIQLPKRKIIYRLHFNGVIGSFPRSYILKNKGNIQIEVPEVYELANILWTLSPSGQRASDLYKQGTYYENIVDYFKPFMDHPVFKKLDFPDSVYFKKYYDFRENSFTFSFKENKLVWEGPYYYVMGDDWDNYNSLFRELIPLIEDFAEKSQYREFYESNGQFYTRQIQRLNELMPIKKMWDWLEEQFPKTKYQSYKIVFSPLIGGSHSTQNYASFNEELFQETVMFICGPDRYDKRTELTEKQKEGLLSGIVFTEIDHNYVNPASNKYAKSIDSIFSNRSFWAGNNTSWYGSSVSVFNEYMTHALFCLWVQDNYDKATADYVIDQRETLMVEKRQFVKFKEFNRALIELRERNKEHKAVDLYPGILESCKTQR